MSLFNKIFIYLRYVRFNNNYFRKKHKNQNRIVLVEFNSFKSFHIAASFLINILADKHKSIIKAYPEINFHQFLDEKNNFFNKLLFYLGKIFKIKNFGIFDSFGVESFVLITKDNSREIKATKISNKYLRSIRTKNNLQNFKLQNILIGDLIYDSYLKYYKKKTIDINDKNFKFFFRKSIEFYLFWISYFKDNEIKGVVAPQSTYMAALPIRIAASLDITSLICDAERLYSLKKNKIYSHKEHVNFKYILKEKELLKNLKKGRSEAKKRLNLRFSGKVGIDISYLAKSPYAKQKNQKNFKINQRDRIKILIAPHSFFDAPHSIGNHLFPDYFVWLEYIFKLSKNTNYDWYVKCHPKFHLEQDPTPSIVNLLCNKYKNVTYLDSSISHHQLISQKINYVVTCNGTIALEYPYLGIPAINGSKNSPVINFKFNYNPNSKDKLKKIILNLRNMKKSNISKNEILDFYFLKNVYFSNDWLFDNINKLIKYCGSFREIQTSFKVYDFFLKNIHPISFENKRKSIINFLNSKDYLFNFKHKGLSLKKHMIIQKKIY